MSYAAHYLKNMMWCRLSFSTWNDNAEYEIRRLAGRIIAGAYSDRDYT